MILQLGRDSGARQSLLEMLPLPDVISLLQSGRVWRDWITSAPSIGGRSIHLRQGLLTHFRQCPWIHRSVHAVGFSSLTATDAHFDELLALMPRWRRIRSFVTTTQLPSVHRRLWSEGFTAVAATLTDLHITTYSSDTRMAEFLLSSVGVLQQLESLSIRQFAYRRELDFAVLPSLPRLQRFELGEATRCTPAQVDALSRCIALTDLQCGPWMPMLGDEEPTQPTIAQIQETEAGLGRLMRLRSKNGAAPLRRLSLGDDGLIFPQWWHALTLSAEWEELCGHWSCTLTADDWMRCVSFQQLRSIGIADLEVEALPCQDGTRALLDLGLAFRALMHCGALRHVWLTGALTLQADHVRMLARFPVLESFEAHCVSIESLAPLSDAPQLTALALHQCSGLNGEWINIRTMIPAMTHLQSLTLYETKENQLSAEAMEPFNAALFARLPKLTPARFWSPRY